MLMSRARNPLPCACSAAPTARRCSAATAAKLMPIRFWLLLTLPVCAAGEGMSSRAPPPLQRSPQVHFTPPCYRNAEPPHDIAAALYDPKAGLYTVMPGCWHAKPGGWQQLSTKDLVSFTLIGEAKSLGGSGGLLIDEGGDMVAYSGSVSMWRASAKDFYQPANSWKPEPGWKQAGGGDPVIWKDERDGRYYGITANGRGGTAANPQGTGFEPMWSSPALYGNASKWEQLHTPFLRVKRTSIARVGNWTRPREFVTPDFFPLGEPASAKAWAFLTTDYGLCGGVPHATDLPGCGRAQGANFSRTFDYASYYIGDRPAPGGSFAPDQEAGVWDWSPFTPAAAGGDGLAFATGKGMEQFGCCPKTSGGPAGRRVLWGWINNGWDQGPPEPHGLEPDRPRPGDGAWLTNNTMSLPRDLSFASRAGGGGRFVAQRFVPELQTLRRARTQLRGVALHGGTVALPESAYGPQLEIVATFRFPSAEAMLLAAAASGNTSSSQQFGLMVLASNGSAHGGTSAAAERTVIRFDLGRGMVLLDRTSSGADLDADVRAGPLPAATTTTNLQVTTAAAPPPPVTAAAAAAAGRSRCTCMSTMQS